MFRSIGKQSKESVKSIQKESYGGKDLQKRKVLSLECKTEGVMDDESSTSMEQVEEVPLKEFGEPESGV